MNQSGDNDHRERTIPYSDDTPEGSAGRVTNKDRCNGWGYEKFLDHATLQNNTTENIQYLKDDHFIVRVVKVKVMQHCSTHATVKTLVYNTIGL